MKGCVGLLVWPKIKRAVIDRYRRPWYWLVVLAALAVAGTAAIALSSRSRLNGIEENFASAQTLRLERVEHNVDDYFAHAKQLTEVATAMSAETVGNERRVRWFVREMFT